MGKKSPPGNPWTVLTELRPTLPPGPAPVPLPVKAPPAPVVPARAVVRLERKGRAGKETTIVEKLELPPAQLETWCKDLKTALGCGGVIEGDTIVLQGDLRRRLEPLLTARGVRKVTIAG